MLYNEQVRGVTPGVGFTRAGRVLRLGNHLLQWYYWIHTTLRYIDSTRGRRYVEWPVYLFWLHHWKFRRLQGMSVFCSIHQPTATRTFRLPSTICMYIVFQVYFLVFFLSFITGIIVILKLFAYIRVSRLCYCMNVFAITGGNYWRCVHGGFRATSTQRRSARGRNR